jgi:tRNA-uridine 2-sulfurtransferase
LEAVLEKRKAKGVVLISGGLDSALAAGVLADQGVDVLGLHFNTGFCVIETKAQTARPDVDPMKFINRAQAMAKELRVPLREVDVSKEFLEVVMNPPHGYGSNVNPCIDCRIVMLRRAAEIMREEGADFVATGEVIGQRPMSQHRGAMVVVERESGLQGRLLRPLCALKLAPTVPEQEGIVDRSKLLGLWGRGRRRQMDLIAQRGIEDYTAPGGGCCFLTDESFARKFKDKVAHRGERRLGWEDMTLLKVGRHIRLSSTLKLVVGRHEPENAFLERMAAGRVLFDCETVMGPVALSDEGLPTDEEERLCASLVARYSDGKNLESLTVLASGGGREPRRYEVAPFHDEERLSSWRI